MSPSDFQPNTTHGTVQIHTNLYKAHAAGTPGSPFSVIFTPKSIYDFNPENANRYEAHATLYRLDMDDYTVQEVQGAVVVKAKGKAQEEGYFSFKIEPAKPLPSAWYKYRVVVKLDGVDQASEESQPVLFF